MRSILIEINQRDGSTRLSVQGTLRVHPGPLIASKDGCVVHEFTSGPLSSHDLQRAVAAVQECLDMWGYAQEELPL